MTTAAIYLRVSTATQTVDSQRPAVEQLARARGLKVVRVFEEQASAVRHRPQWEACKAAGLRGEYDVLIVAAIDRLGRSMAGNITEILALDRAGVQVVSVREPWLDTGGPVRDLLVAIFSWVAAEERRVIGMRCKAGQDRARRQGKHCGRPRTPVDRDRLVELHAAGLSVRKIATQLGVSRTVVARVIGELDAGSKAETSTPPSASDPTIKKPRQIEASTSP